MYNTYIYIYTVYTYAQCKLDNNGAYMQKKIYMARCGHHLLQWTYARVEPQSATYSHAPCSYTVYCIKAVKLGAPQEIRLCIARFKCSWKWTYPHVQLSCGLRQQWKPMEIKICHACRLTGSKDAINSACHQAAHDQRGHVVKSE